MPAGTRSFIARFINRQVDIWILRGPSFANPEVPAAESQIGASELLRLLSLVVRISEAGEQVNAKKRAL